MRVIGLMSGTSVDGIDAALVEIAGTTTDLKVDLLTATTYPYALELRSQILAVCAGAPLSMTDFARLDDAIAQTFAQAAIALQTNQPPAHLIGSHGQTVFHRPVTADPRSLGYSLQLGRGDLIAHLTQIPTISNFRAADIAMQGQGAPLVSAIDRVLLVHPTQNRCIQNIGGIANVTYLPASLSPTPHPPTSPSLPPPIYGWDTGPGNALLDLAVQQLSQGQLSFDRDGAWAAQGTPCQALIDRWLQQDFFHLPPPKSTGRELFGQDYLQHCLSDMAVVDLSDADKLATLTELTVASIAHSYRTFLPQIPDQVLLCGGGSHNQYLKTRLQSQLKSSEVCTTDDVGLNADFKEAIAFAVLAYWSQQGIPGNLPEVTGAKRAVPLGELHLVA